MEMPNVTSGPYMLTEYERDNFWRLEARADYWGKPANITHVIVRAFADNQAQMAAMEAGEIDVTAVPAAEVERFAQPQAHAWAELGEELRPVQREPKRSETDKALACFGDARHDTDEVLLYFSDGQPNSLQMWLFIIGLLAVARAEGKQVLVIIWDNASWHKSAELRG